MMNTHPVANMMVVSKSRSNAAEGHGKNGGGKKNFFHETSSGAVTE
jgi:hypothetical protein